VRAIDYDFWDTGSGLVEEALMTEAKEDIPSNATDAYAIAASADASSELSKWQFRLLPYMAVSVVVLAIVYFVLGVQSISSISAFLRNDPAAPITSQVNQLLATQPKAHLSNAEVMQQGLLLLEADTLERRYRQASALLMSRIWTRQLAFNTGMVLALIGAVFILGKLRESSSNLGFVSASWKAQITSASPGLILASLGVVLMGIALVAQPPIDVNDKAIYFMSTQAAPNGQDQSALGQNTKNVPPVDPDPMANERTNEKPRR
jgi:hypothetical protein